MASIGVRYLESPYGGGVTSLGDTLAKAFVGDPEFDLKLKLAQSNMANDAAQRRVYDAQIANYGANTGLLTSKKATEDWQRTSRQAAGPAAGDLLSSRIADPVPVQMQGPVRLGVDAPLPAIVTPAARARVDKLREDMRTLGPAIVSMGDSPESLMKSLGVGAGLGGLVGGSTSPADARRDFGLYTGKTPDVNDVAVAGDTAGVDAAARAKNLEPRNPLLIKKGETPYTVTVDENGRQVVTPTEGYTPPAATTDGAYPDTTVAGVDRNNIDAIAEKFRTNQPISPREAAAYSAAMQELVKPTVTEITDPDTGNKTLVSVPGRAPVGLPTAVEVLQRAGGAAPGTTAPATLAPVPAAAVPPAPASPPTVTAPAVDPSLLTPPSVPPSPLAAAGGTGGPSPTPAVAAVAPPPAATVAPATPAVAAAPAPAAPAAAPAAVPAAAAASPAPDAPPPGTPQVPLVGDPTKTVIDNSNKPPPGVTMTTDPNTGISTISLPGGASSAKLTEADRKMGFLAAGIINARSNLTDEPPPDAWKTYLIRNYEMIPQEVRNKFLTPGEQRYAQSWYDILANLRYLRSGQASTASEIANDFITFMPTGGEDPAVSAQKLKALDTEIQAATAMSPAPVQKFLTDLQKQRGPGGVPGRSTTTDPGSTGAGSPAPGAPARLKWSPDGGLQ